jgi:hypothetical protein
VDLEAAQRLFGRCDTLATAIQVGFAQRPPWSVVDVINQDEFTLDVILQATPDGPAIVLDCT